MIILKDERSPQYFGAVSRKCGESIKNCPYGKGDEQKEKDWLNGYERGYIER